MIENIIEKTIDLLKDVDFYGTIFETGEEEASAWMREEIETNAIGFYQDTKKWLYQFEEEEDFPKWAAALEGIRDLIMAL